jgi:hypothetical protein
MDGWHFADAAKYGVDRPYLWMNDDTPLPGTADLVAPDPARRYTAILNQRDHDSAMENIRRLGGIIMTVSGSRHADFSDQPGQWLRRFADRQIAAPLQQIVWTMPLASSGDPRRPAPLRSPAILASSRSHLDIGHLGIAQARR